MTVAYVLKMYPRFSETFVVNEILELERQGVDMRIYSLRKPDDGRFHAAIARVRAPVIYLPEYLPAQLERVFAAQRAAWGAGARRYLRVLHYALVTGGVSTLKRFAQAGVLAQHLRANPADHLHAHFASSATRVAQYAHLLTGVPYSFTAHAKDIYLNTVNPDILRDKMRAASFVVTVSEFNRRHLSELAAGGGHTHLAGLLPPERLRLPAARVRRLYNGVDAGQFSPEGAPPQAARAPLVLAVGRLVEKKGFDVLLHACALLRRQGAAVRCEIAGKGPQEEALRGLATSLDLRDSVTFTGPLPQEDVVAAYRRAAVFALPCVVGTDGNRDGLPTVLLEAMAMSVPVVSTDLTGVPEIVDHDVNGLLVAQKDPVALAGALGRLLAAPALREQLGAAGRAKVMHQFDLHQNVGVLKEWLAA